MNFQKFISFCFIIFFAGCTSKKEEGVIISDGTLYNFANTISSFTYLHKSSDTLRAAPESPHGRFVRVRFNSKALSAMNDSVSALKLSDFPDESMIVKEAYDSRGGALVGYAMMYKLRNAANNGSGWIWSEMNPDGSVIYSSSNRGGECVYCHSEAGNSDLVRSFRLH